MIAMNEHFNIINDDKYLNFLSRTYGEKNQQLVFARMRKKIPTAKMR